MAYGFRQGIRVKLKESQAKTKKSNAVRMREYRARLKENPELFELQRQKNNDRNRQNRLKPKSEEEKARLREASRLRMQKSRERRKAEELAVVSLTPTPQPLTRSTEQRKGLALTAKRKEWSEQKRKQREKWSAQKWRRHREKNLKNYYKRKEERSLLAGKPKDVATASCENATNEADVAETVTASGGEVLLSSASGTPPKSKGALRKSLYRCKKLLLECGISMPTIKALFQKQTKPETPKSKQVSRNLNSKLDAMKGGRSKTTLAARKLLLDVAQAPSQGQSSPYKRKKVQEATQLSLKFMENESVHLPGKRSVSKRTLEQKKVMPKRLKHVYKDFKLQHPRQKISLRTWYRILPDHIKTSSTQTFRQALCELCVNVDLKLDSLNVHLAKEINGRDELSEMSLCHPVTLKCLDRLCGECGVEQVSSKIVEMLTCKPTSPVSWMQWDLIKKEKGQRKEKMEHWGMVSDLVQGLMNGLKTFSRHVFVHRWQTLQFRGLLKGVASENYAVAVGDFAENYLCRWQDEVHSAHWGYSQVTVHPVVLYYPCKICKLDKVTEYLIYLTDDLNHDAHLANTIIMCAKKKINEHGITRTFIWSDGCAAQYKSKLPFFYAANEKLEWSFFGSRHGKSACDAAGGVIKSAVDHDVRAMGITVQNAAQMHAHLSTHHCMPEQPLPEGSCSHIRRSFHLIRPQDIDRTVESASLKTVSGTRQIQSVKGLGENQLLVRNLSCFCHHCMSNGVEGEKCKSADFAGAWRPVTIGLSSMDAGTHAPEVTFESIYTKISAADTFSKLRQVCQEASHFVANKETPGKDHFITQMVGVAVDRIAHGLLPADAPERHLPLLTVGDGNCFLRSLSTLCYGHQEQHLEMRVRLTVEMCVNLETYTNPSFIAQSSGDDGHKLLRALAIYSESYEPQKTHRQCLEAEIFRVRLLGQDCCMWHLYGAASILKCPLVSVYPDLGQQDMRQLCKRVVQPVLSERTAPRHIMWTSSAQDQCDEYWAPRHFVPLLPLHPEDISNRLSIEAEPENGHAPDSTFTVAVNERRLSLQDESVNGHIETGHTLDGTLNVAFNEGRLSLQDESVNGHIETGHTLDGTLNVAFNEGRLSLQDESVNGHIETGHTLDGTLNVAFNEGRSPETDMFYSFKWQDGKEYICQILSVLPDEELVEVSFMAKQGNLVYWHSEPDTSWEDLQTFSEKSRLVSVVLNEERSTQRKQLFNVLF